MKLDWDIIKNDNLRRVVAVKGDTITAKTLYGEPWDYGAHQLKLVEPTDEEAYAWAIKDLSE